MRIRQCIGYIGLSTIGIGGLVLAILMAWSLWKLHAFTPMFWMLAFSPTLISLLLRAQFKPPPAKWWETYLLQLAVALAVLIGGAFLSPTLNTGLQR